MNWHEGYFCKISEGSGVIFHCNFGVYNVEIRKSQTGAIAQLGERYNGIVEVGGSTPPGSTTQNLKLIGEWLCQY